MMCHRIGLPPISTMGLGLVSVSSESRLPTPPARIATFTLSPPSDVARACTHRVDSLARCARRTATHRGGRNTPRGEKGRCGWAAAGARVPSTVRSRYGDAVGFGATRPVREHPEPAGQAGEPDPFPSLPERKAHVSPRHVD